MNISDIVKNEFALLKKEHLINPQKILCCVSGGVDSMVLLSILSELHKELNFSLIAISVNHNIRSTEETQLDLSIVKSFCNKINVNCVIKTIPCGQIQQVSKERNRGIEEAARFLRYNIFDQVARELNCDLICTAHTQDDNLETILQRFLQGASSASFAGILKLRDNFFRPLLEVSKEQLLQYSLENNIPYNNDSTNQDESYFRNNIRLNLVPLLDQKFVGWKNSVLTSSKKISEDGIFLQSLCKKLNWILENEYIYCKLDDFNQFSVNLQIECLKNALLKLKCKHRISDVFLRNFCKNLKYCKTKEFEFFISDNKVFIKKIHKFMTNTSFFAIIEEDNCKYSVICDYHQNEKE